MLSYQALDDLNQAEEDKARQALYGEKAFKEWLDNRGIDSVNTGPPKKREPIVKKPTKKDKEKAEEGAQASSKQSLYKANSMRRPLPPAIHSPIREEPELNRKVRDHLPYTVLSVRNLR